MKLARPSANGETGCSIGPSTSHQSERPNSNENDSSALPRLENGIDRITFSSPESKNIDCSLFQFQAPNGGNVYDQFYLSRVSLTGRNLNDYIVSIYEIMRVTAICSGYSD